MLFEILFCGLESEMYQSMEITEISWGVMGTLFCERLGEGHVVIQAAEDSGSTPADGFQPERSGLQVRLSRLHAAQGHGHHVIHTPDIAELGIK